MCKILVDKYHLGLATGFVVAVIDAETGCMGRALSSTGETVSSAQLPGSNGVTSSNRSCSFTTESRSFERIGVLSLFVSSLALLVSESR